MPAADRDYNPRVPNRKADLKPAYTPRDAGKHRAPGAPLLYYITDRAQLSADEVEACERVETCILHAARAGIDYIQLREKDMTARALEELAYVASAALEEARRDAGSASRLLINGRIDVAIACGAAGVHLPATNAVSAADARAALHHAGVHSPVIAVSCHSAAEVARAAAEGADFAVFGPVFGKGPDAAGERVTPAGCEALRGACAAAMGMPVFALGAVTVENAAACLRAGARGLAGIRLFQHAEVAATIEHLRHLGA